MATTDWVKKYMQAYEPSIQRETNRADAQMASRGLYRSTAGAGYTDARRNDLMAQAYREALTTGESARQADMQDTTTRRGQSLQDSQYRLGDSTTRRGQDNTYSLGQAQNAISGYDTLYGYTLGSRELAENPKLKVKVPAALQKILKQTGDARETWNGVDGDDFLTTSGRDNRGARLDRQINIQEQDLLAQQRIAAARNALESRKIAAEQRFADESAAWDRDPKNILLSMMRDEMASGSGQVDPVTGEPVGGNPAVKWAGIYQSIMGRPLYDDYQQGDDFARGFLSYLNDPTFAESIQTRIPGLTPTMRAEQIAANTPPEPTFWEGIRSSNVPRMQEAQVRDANRYGPILSALGLSVPRPASSDATLPAFMRR